MLPLLISIMSLLSPKPFCSCLELGPIDDQQYNSYSLIFKGKMLKDTVIGLERHLTFSVGKYYKGIEVQTTQEITTPSNSAMCGINPLLGDEWLIFAYGEKLNYTVSLCSRSKNISQKVWEHNKKEIESDLKFLEKKLKVKAS
jgi:hypothetical protein